ncbi:MAG: enoyl-CoA hydratase-related protein [Acidimicrobiia bacterium]|nr:enoyl-CoA hydratase-related protein [Acidimicrobiia bacterium]
MPPGQLDHAVGELAATLASKSAAVLQLGRESFYTALDQSARDALAMLHPLLAVTAELDDAAEGMAAFAEKRQPRWRGR